MPVLAIDWVTDPAFDDAHALREKILNKENEMSQLSTDEWTEIDDLYRVATGTLNSTLRYLNKQYSQCDNSEDKRVVHIKIRQCEQKITDIKNELSYLTMESTKMDQANPTPDGTTNSAEKVSVSYDKSSSTESTVDNDNNEFKIVRNNKRKIENNTDNFNFQKNKMSHQIPTNGISVNNIFGNLKGEVLLHDKSVPQPPVRNMKRVSAPKVRPITIKNVENLKNKLDVIEKEGRCKFVVMPSGDFTKIFPQNPEDYSKIIEYLPKMQIQHYLFSEKTIQPLKVVVRGLRSDANIDEINEELTSLNYNVIKIVQLESFRTKLKLPLFQIQLENNTKSKEIYQEYKLLHHKIEIENYRNPTRTLQCFNCQYYHHASSNCKMQARCVKCSGPHQTSECDQGKGNINQVKCCNCGQNHVASYRGCPKFPENRKKPITFNSNLINSTKSFANAIAPPTPAAQTRSHSSTPQSTTTDSFNFNSFKEIVNEMAQLLNVSNFQELISKYQLALQRMKNTNNQIERLSIFMEVISQQPIP